MKIAILGGTFNPIHQGHLLIAENAVKSLNLDKVFFAPCSIPPHKTEHQLLPDHHRVAMVKLGISGKPKFDILTFEIDRKGTSYTVDTVSHLSSQYPNDQIFFILGSDSFQEIGYWRSFAKLAAFCNFFAVERPGYPLKLPPPSVPKSQLPLLRYTLCNQPAISVSSSQVRELLHHGKDISGLVPSSVHHYIQTHHLYQ